MTMNGLILIHPAITTTPATLEAHKNKLKQDGLTNIDQYLANKVNDDMVTLDDGKYDVVSYLTPEKPDAMKFPKKLIPVLKASLKDEGKLLGLSDIYKLDALLNGFEVCNTDTDFIWIKKIECKGSSASTASISLKNSVSLPNKKKSTSSALPTFTKSNNNKLPTFKKASLEIKVAKTELDDDDLDNDTTTADKSKYFNLNNTNDEIDESDLIDMDAQNRINEITMITCGRTKTKRKKACKDCSCGLKEEEETEIEGVRMQQEKVVKLNEDELTEIDFTIEGKKVGGCGSCTLGDAFRCSGCPYLGLPAFKPGQPISLASISDDL